MTDDPRTTGAASGTPETRRPARLRFQPRQIALLTLIWLVLVGQVNVVTVLGGALLAWIITVVFPLPPIDYAGRLHPWRTLVLGLHLLKDLAVSSVKLVGYAFGRRVPHPGIVRVALRSDSDLYEVNTAELASVVPGTIVVDARRKPRLLYLHVFDLPDPGERQQTIDDTLALERRVVGAFGTREERREVALPGSRDARPPRGGAEPEGRPTDTTGEDA
ncbi:Na+/H+ antiporter subunit E [Propioniciclava coleopterorum]|uniref:Na+/H+ antiporter subunit E n=1 Tax=Propioniciclava coleopterorum TaxID=2714937 RepID=A0A6G7Y2V8_9ACTN|nr:Na+/H+ antiporter subunit E [Propioniciclava coleopterorum]QIK71142.1 Na+/H+ antiporter subunit E [Propioniciclava coleopterorum]